MTNSFRRAAIAAFLVVGGARAHAQITTAFGGPKRNEAAAQQQAARVQQAAQDSVARVTLTNMTKWVDSAASALALRPDTGTISRSDTALAQSPAPRPSRSDSAAKTAARDTTADMRSGARAPNTATPVPTIALAGVILIASGLVMRRRPRAARARAGR